MWVIVLPALITGVLSAEIILRGVHAGIHTEVMGLAHKALRVLSAKHGSDDRKQQLLLAYSARMMKSALRLSAYLIVWVVLVGAVIALFSWRNEAAASALFTVSGLAISTASAVVYGHFKAKTIGSDYGLLSRAVHHIALGVSPIGELCIDLDSLFPRKEAVQPQGPHVFVAGLARAGTTLLMRRLYATGDFRSLTYRDMPFPLAPRLWSQFRPAGGARLESKGRAHGDGLLVNPESPEAFEEVFWRVFCGESYIQKECLLPHEVDSETIDKFRGYVKAIIESGDNPAATRYLSKNNNNILRLTAITWAFPEATILVPFRDPVQQAISLHRQHQLFLQIHERNPFGRRYMRWLGHYEFGADHRRFKFDEHVPRYSPADGVDYWLETWVRVYGWLSKHHPSQVVFFDYDHFCVHPDKTWQALSDWLRLSECRDADVVAARPKQEWSEAIDCDLRDDACAIHRDLVRLSSRLWEMAGGV